MESAQNKVLLPVQCTLSTVNALLHPREVHLGSSCLPLHCDDWRGGQVTCSRVGAVELHHGK